MSLHTPHSHVRHARSTAGPRRRRLVGVVLAVASAGVLGALSAPALGAPAATAPAVTDVAAATGCAASPHQCGYPDASTTGVPSGTTLVQVPAQRRSGAGWYYDDNDGVVVTGAGAVLSGLDIANSIEVKASGVQIVNCRVVTRGDWWGIGLYHASNVTVAHTRITSPVMTGADRLEVGIKDVYGDARGTQVVADNISHTSTGVQFNNGLIKDSYIHDLGYAPGDHLNGITSNAGSDSAHPLVVTHNTVFDQHDQTDAISLFEDFGSQQYATISNNLVAGGSYSIYGGANAGGAATSHIAITGNRFSTRYFSTGGTFGPIAAFDPRGAANVWSDNKWIDGPRAGGSIGV